MIKISVIIPLCNQEQYICDALDSVLDQSLHPHEIIVVNDGSTDSSLAIAKGYESKGIRIIDQVNKGLASARNTGIMNATGDYILPLDSDDIIIEECIERIVEKIEETDADIVAPSFKAFGKYNTEVMLSDGLRVEHFLDANRIPYCSAVRRSALLEIGGYNPKMVFGWEDYDMWIDLLKRGKTIATINEILFLYRTKEVSMITEANKHAQELTQQMRMNHPELAWPQ